MRQLLCCLLFYIATATMADNYQQLYKITGWPIHIAHFHDAVDLVQQQYKTVLPPFAYQALHINIEQQFNLKTMRERSEQALRKGLDNPEKALVFFNSDLGQKITKAETRATSKEYLQKNAQGLPLIKVSEKRQVLISRLARAIPYEQAAVDTTLALTNFAKNFLDSLLPNMGLGNLLKTITPTEEAIKQQINKELINTLCHVYESLSDSDLQAFAVFAESAAGKNYYQTVLQMLQVGLYNE